MARRARSRLVVALVTAGALVAACSAGGSAGGIGESLPDAVAPAPLPQPLVGGPGSSDGAHRVPGTGALAGARTIDVALDAPPVWVVGAATEGATWWVVVDAVGNVRGLRVPDDDPDAHHEVPVQPDRLPPGAPPVVETVNPLALVVPPDDAAPLAPPLRLLPDGRAAVLEDGSLRLGDGPGAPVLDVDAPLDARMAVDPVTGALAVPAGAEAPAGGGAGATGLVVVGVDGSVEVVATPPGEVLEGLGPAWVDLEGDGRPELATVVRSAAAGSRVVTFGLDGSRRVAPGGVGGIRLVGGTFLGPEGERELVAVRDGGGPPEVVWYRPGDGEGLEEVARLAGYRSDLEGTGDLDLAVLTDATGDGRADVVLPTADRRAIAVLARVAEPPGAVEAARLDLPGPLVTNVAAVGRLRRPLALGVGTADGLRLWFAAPGQRDAPAP